MAAPTAELERLSVSRVLWHGGHPVLRWNASNVSVRQDPGTSNRTKSARPNASMAYQPSSMRWDVD
jgi:phage terminase large subunit-like protein